MKVPVKSVRQKRPNGIVKWFFPLFLATFIIHLLYKKNRGNEEIPEQRNKGIQNPDLGNLVNAKGGKASRSIDENDIDNTIDNFNLDDV